MIEDVATCEVSGIRLRAVSLIEVMAEHSIVTASGKGEEEGEVASLLDFLDQGPVSDSCPL